jgi:hypothetical protein
MMGKEMMIGSDGELSVSSLPVVSEPSLPGVSEVVTRHCWSDVSKD